MLKPELVILIWNDLPGDQNWIPILGHPIYTILEIHICYFVHRDCGSLMVILRGMLLPRASARLR